MKAPVRFPKVVAPFERSTNINGDYTVDPTVNDTYSWVFDQASEVEAVEKLHGTNMAIRVEDGDIVAAARRNNDRTMSLVTPYAYSDRHFVRGVQNSRKRFSYMEKDFDGDGWYFGELVGPNVHDNPYKLDEHLFVPFEWLRRKATYKSYGKYSVEYDGISDWFKGGLFSLFYALMHGIDDLNEASVSNGVFVEGIVFVHPNFDGHVGTADLETTATETHDNVAVPLAKLRRDMFDWFEGERH